MPAIAIPESIEKRLAKLSHLTGRPANDFVLEAVEAHLEEFEDAYIAMERIKNPAKRWTMDDLENGLDLER